LSTKKQEREAFSRNFIQLLLLFYHTLALFPSFTPSISFPVSRPPLRVDGEGGEEKGRGVGWRKRPPAFSSLPSFLLRGREGGMKTSKGERGERFLPLNVELGPSSRFFLFSSAERSRGNVCAHCTDSRGREREREGKKRSGFEWRGISSFSSVRFSVGQNANPDVTGGRREKATSRNREASYIL
jgi:hypothetical protein